MPILNSSIHGSLPVPGVVRDASSMVIPSTLQPQTDLSILAKSIPSKSATTQ